MTIKQHVLILLNIQFSMFEKLHTLQTSLGVILRNAVPKLHFDTSLDDV